MKYIVLIFALFFTFCVQSQTIRIPLHELESGTQGQQIGVNSDSDQEYYTLIEGARDTIIVWNPLLFRFEYRTKSSLLSGYPTGSGTTNTFPIWTGSTTLGNSSLVWNPTYSRFEFGGTAGLVFPNGTTAQRSSVPTTGETRWNTTIGRAETYNGSAWVQSSFPVGTSGQTLRHDGSNWIANSVLTNDGTNVATTGIMSAKAVGSLESRTIKVSSPSGAALQAFGGTGAIEITLPDLPSVNIFAVSFRVQINTGGNGVVYNIFAYGSEQASGSRAFFWQSNTFYNGSQQQTGQSVRFGTESSRLKIWIGELTTSWTAVLSVQITDVVYYPLTGGVPTVPQVAEGWAIALEASAFGTVQETRTNVSVFARNVGIDNTGSIRRGVENLPILAHRYLGNFTGAIEITLPPSSAALTSLALGAKFRTSVFLNGTSLSKVRELIISGDYNYNTRVWANTSAIWATGAFPNIPIRFGNDGTRGKIWIGELAYSWGGADAYISNMDMLTLDATAAGLDAFKVGWDVNTESTAFNTVAATVSAIAAGAIPYTGGTEFQYDANFFRTATQFKVGNYIFNTDQTLSSGQNGYALTWNNSSGEFEATAVIDGNGIYGGSDDLTDAVVTFARMPVFADIDLFTDFDGFTLGSFDAALESNFNFLNYDNTEYGLYVLPKYQGVGLINGDGSTSLSEINLSEASAALTANAASDFGSVFLGTNRAEVYTDDETTSSSGRRAGFFASSANTSSQGEGASIWYQYDQTGSANKYLIAGFEEGNNVSANPKLPISVTERGFYIQDYKQGSSTKELLRITEGGEAYIQDFAHVGGTFFTQTVIDTVNNTASEISIIGTGEGTLTIPANYLRAGRTIVCHGSGWWLNNSVAPSLDFRQYIGATEVGDTGAGSMPDLGGGQEYWTYETEMTCQTAGASGTVMTQGKWEWFYSDFTDGRRLTFSNTATATINTTTSQTLDFTVQMGSADANAYVVMTNFYCEAKN